MPPWIIERNDSVYQFFLLPTNRTEACWIKMTCTGHKDILIVGGSLTGLVVALACANCGIKTRVLERVSGLHHGGGALGIDRTLLLRVACPGTEIDGPASDFPVITSGRKAISWLALHRWLYAQVLRRDEITVCKGITVAAVAQDNTQATAFTTEGQQMEAPIIVGADGYKSVVRRAMMPDRPHGEYAGYLLWRGLVSEQELPSDTIWPGGDAGVGFITRTGYRLIAYPVAGRDDSLEPGKRRISFTWYDTTHDALLEAQGCLSPTHQVLASMPQEHVPRETGNELCKLAREIWPEPWRAFILHALERRDVFATPAVEYYPDCIHHGRLALAGDAAHVVSPMTGRGFVAGILDAEALADCLGQIVHRSGSNFLSALDRYGRIRLGEGQKLVQNSVRLSRAYVSQVRRGNHFQEKR